MSVVLEGERCPLMYVIGLATRVPHIGADSHHVKPRRLQQPYLFTTSPSHHRTGWVLRKKIHRSSISSSSTASSSVFYRPIRIHIISGHRILVAARPILDAGCPIRIVADRWAAGAQAHSCGGARRLPPPLARPLPFILRRARGAENAGPSST